LGRQSDWRLMGRESSYWPRGLWPLAALEDNQAVAILCRTRGFARLRRRLARLVFSLVRERLGRLERLERLEILVRLRQLGC